MSLNLIVYAGCGHLTSGPDGLSRSHSVWTVLPEASRHNATEHFWTGNTQLWISVIPELGKLLVHALNTLEGVNRAFFSVPVLQVTTQWYSGSLEWTHTFMLIVGLLINYWDNCLNSTQTATGRLPPRPRFDLICCRWPRHFATEPCERLCTHVSPVTGPTCPFLF